MSESGDESSLSENNWPMNEEWLIGILKMDDQTDGSVKINVNPFGKTIEKCTILFHKRSISVRRPSASTVLAT